MYPPQHPAGEVQYALGSGDRGDYDSHGSPRFGQPPGGAVRGVNLDNCRMAGRRTSGNTPKKASSRRWNSDRFG